MDISKDITLSLPEGDLTSKLKEHIYLEELKEINSKYPIHENQIDIIKTYLIQDHNNIEAGFFIRNGLNSRISLGEISLLIDDDKGTVIIEKDFDLGDDGNIPPLSARPFTVIFNAGNNIKLEKENIYNIKFNKTKVFRGFSSVKTEVENLPIDISFEEEQNLQNFINELETLKEGEFTVSPYKLSCDEDNRIACRLLLRNGSSREGTIKKLPITIVDETNKVIAKKLFENEAGLANVASKKSKLICLQFESSELPIGKYDISNLKIVIG